MRAICLGLLIALCACGSAAAAPFGFSDPVRVGGARVAVDVAAAGPGGTGVVAWLDSAGEIHAVRMGANGVIGADRTVARGQRTARDLQAVVTDRGETVLVWSSLSRERNAVAQIAASPAGVWGKLHTLSALGSYTAAMPQLAALSGGTVAAIWRDRSGLDGEATVRYARRAPGRLFGAGRSLGHDGVHPQVAATADGGALLSWQRGPTGPRVAVIARARRGAPLPGPGHDVAGHVRLAAPLFAAADGTVALSWIRRDGTTSTARTRAVAPNVGPVRDLDAHDVIEPAQLAVGAGRMSVATWIGYTGGARILAATAADLGRWSAPVALHARAAGIDGQPQPVILHDGTALVAWPKSHDQVGPPMYDAAIGEVGAPTPDQPQTLGATAGPVGVRLVRGGGRVIAAWPDPAAGVRIATRPA